jgi:hypothetical protein
MAKAEPCMTVSLVSVGIPTSMVVLTAWQISPGHCECPHRE